MRKETGERNRLIREGRFDAAADPRESLVAPKPQDPVPELDFAPLEKAIVHLQRSAREHDRARRELENSGKTLTGEAGRLLDEVLMKTERALTRDEGLPRRPWYKHFIYAPGFYTGYGVKTLPGVREAIEQRNWNEARAQIDIVSQTIERYASEIDRATGLLRGPGKS